MAALEEGFQYGLSSNSISTSNRSVVQVKLTDTSLRIIEEYLRRKPSCTQKPCIQFQGNQGSIQIPEGGDSLRTFHFSLSAIQGDPNGSFDAVCQTSS
ncbi:RNA polymerase II elongation factor ELL-like, partial [Ruditapes philippinarum]